MSRKWNIKCMVCADPQKPAHLDDAVLELGDESNHNEEGAVTIAKAASELAALGRAVQNAFVEIGDIRFPAVWFTVHTDHKLVVVSEYGDLSDLFWPEAMKNG